MANKTFTLCKANSREILFWAIQQVCTLSVKKQAILICLTEKQANFSQVGWPFSLAKQKSVTTPSFPFFQVQGHSVAYILVPQPPGVFDYSESPAPPRPLFWVLFKFAQAGSSMGGEGVVRAFPGCGSSQGVSSVVLHCCAQQPGCRVSFQDSCLYFTSLCTSVALLSLWGSDPGPPACTARASPIKPLFSHDCYFLRCDWRWANKFTLVTIGDRVISINMWKPFRLWWINSPSKSSCSDWLHCDVDTEQHILPCDYTFWLLFF